MIVEFKIVFMKTIIFFLISSSLIAQNRNIISVDAGLINNYSSFSFKIDELMLPYKGVSSNLTNNIKLSNSFSSYYGFGFTRGFKNGNNIGLFYKDLSIINNRISSSPLSIGSGGFEIAIRQLGLILEKELRINNHSSFSIKISPSISFVRSVLISQLKGGGAIANPPVDSVLSFLHEIKLLTSNNISKSININLGYNSKINDNSNIRFYVETGLMIDKPYFLQVRARDTSTLILAEEYTGKSENFRLNWFSFGIGYSFWQKPKPKVEQ